MNVASNDAVLLLPASTNSAVTSPTAPDSPATPVSNLETDTVKIAHGSDYSEVPILPLVEPVKVEVASHMPEVGTPVDPDSIPVNPPNGTPPPPFGQLLPDVQMAESSTGVTNQPVDLHEDASMKTDTMSSPSVNGYMPDPHGTNGVNGHSTDIDVNMNGSLETIVAAEPTPSPMRRSADMSIDEPPAKRARKMSDDDQAPATFANPTDPSSVASPQPFTPAPVSTEAGPPLTITQWRFCGSCLRQIKKSKDAGPFLRPVDPVLLNIPHYPTIIKHPMDFGTIERKLMASNPAKPDPHPENPRYVNAEQFVADVRRVFNNCLTFNGPDHLVSQMAKRLEGIFDKQIKHLPAADEPVKKEVTPPARKSGGPPVRRPSNPVPPIRRDEANNRPKREIHAPPPRELAYNEPKRVKKPRAVKDEATAEQLRFCGKVLSELHKKQHYNYASPFYEPVDWVKLEIPSYPKLIKKPMDLSTIRKKLENHEYLNAQRFQEDFRLMIRNCFTFNPQGTPVNQAGMELQRVFDEKWRGLPNVDQSDVDEDDDEDTSEDERARAIAAMESQMETMRQNLTALKKGTDIPKKAPKQEKKAPKPAPPPPVASSSKPKAPKKSSSASAVTKPSKKGKGKLAEDDALSFDQKKALSDAIGSLDGPKLERVIQIIHEGVPEIRDSTEEIELEIDALPSTVLTKLYNFVLKPARSSNGPKRNRPSKGGGTGGLKRKSMDEDVEAEKIRQLEERMAMFEQQGNGSASHAPPTTAHESESESDSGSDSDSDSE